MSYKRTFLVDVSSDSAKYGLSSLLYAILYDESGIEVATFDHTFLEVASGVYQINIDGIPNRHRGSLLIFGNINYPDTQSSSEDIAYFLGGFAINPEECEYIKALYHSEINLTIDNIDGVDVWTVAFFENGVQLTNTELSSPRLLILDETGSTVVNGVLTQLGSTYFYRYSASGANRIVEGEPFNAVAYATMPDNVIHEFPRIIGRDT